jgi:hypothetical protein
MKTRNTPIGEVECPHKGCAETCKVFRFQARTEGRRTVFSGKHYAECPKHGRIGADGNPATTEYILENATIWAPKQTTGTAPADSGKVPAPPAKTPAPRPAPERPRSSPAKISESATPARSPWRTLID